MEGEVLENEEASGYLGRRFSHETLSLNGENSQIDGGHKGEAFF